MKVFKTILLASLVIFVFQLSVQAQVAGSISGTVTDESGALVPGANVVIKGESGQEFTVTTNQDGYFVVPGVAAGTPTYRVTVSAANFKTAIVENVKVDVASPSTVNVVLQAGRIEESVVITSGNEVLQTETATVGTTITGRQILETPIQSRDALDLVATLPGTAVVGAVRTSSINGLPKSALTIQIDGVDVQDNYLKSSDGFFTFIRPRIDAIDEVTVSTANPGAESSGDGAVGIRFATRRGTDEYKGSAFWQHRDESLNANNFQNNYLRQVRTKLRLNQFGASFGGPLPFLDFGEGGPVFDSGKGKNFFFVNYERFHLNEQSPVRTRQVLTAEAQSGIFRYGAATPNTPAGSRTVNLFALAAAAGLTNTVDPTVANVLNVIRASTGVRGSFDNLGLNGTFYRQNFNFANSGEQRRSFLVARTDFNITKDHALEVIFNNQPFRSNVDFLNSVDPAFPDFDNAGTQQSDRRSLSVGFRSNFGSTVVNQFRYAQLAGWLGGASNFDLVGGLDFFTDLQRGYALTLGAGLTNPTIRNAFSSRVSPTEDFTDNITWIKGNHTFTFGGQLKRIRTISDSVGQYVPTITFGAAANDTAVNCTQTNPVLCPFTTTTMPGANATEIANAQALYATLTGRISAFGSSGVLGPDGQYTLNGSRFFEIQENTNGLFAQDSWKIRNNLTINYGVRWQPSLGARMNTANYSVLVDPNQIYDVSGVGNQFSPGTLTGTVPRVQGVAVGDKAFRDDYNNFAPSIGVVWSPEGQGGFLKFIFGDSGDSVFRGGYSRAFIREGTLIVENSLGLHPGGSFSLARNAGLGNLSVGSLFRTPGNPNINAPAFNATPVYPRTLNGADAAFSFADDFRTGYVDSFSFGYQRQVGRDTVVEMRYVGNRGKDMQNQYNLNETNAIENGLGAEFALAQQNLLANIAAGRGSNFRYFGAGTGTSPLPIILSYFVGNNLDPNSPASYLVPAMPVPTNFAANFSNAAYVNALSVANPNVLGFVGTMEATAGLRNNAYTTGTIRAARPLNFINNCPTTLGACFLFDNSETSSYDAVQIEVRRRISNGVRFQASYTFGKSFTNAYASANTAVFGLGAGDQSNATNKTLRNPELDNSPSQVDIRHAFKFDATVDLPFGKGRSLLSSNNWFSNALFGGWSLTPIMRWQSGSPILLENVQLVGMTAKELQDAIGVYYNQSLNGSAVPNAQVTWLPADIIDNTIRAFTTTGSTANGYTGAAPTGRFIAPAGYGNCQQRSPGQCGFRKLVIYGPSFYKLDASVQKRIAVGERRNIEMRATFFDVLNRTNWRLGGWTGNVNNITAFTGAFGQMGTGWSYQDPNGSNDPGGRIMDLSLRINF